MSLRAKWQFMDRSVTHKIVYGPQLRFGPYNILWVTFRSINCHMALNAKKEFEQNPEENIILIGPGPYTKILTDCTNKDK
jgi:hypothetical protein